MKIQYRMVKQGERYSPQMRIRKFLFWSKWIKIAKHPCKKYDFILESIEYSLKTKAECEEVIEGFDIWFRDKLKESKSEKSYIPYICKGL